MLCKFTDKGTDHALRVCPQMNESMMLNQQTTSLMRAIDAFNEAIMLVDTGEASWTVMFINDAWLRMMGAPAVQFLTRAISPCRASIPFVSSAATTVFMVQDVSLSSTLVSAC